MSEENQEQGAALSTAVFEAMLSDPRVKRGTESFQAVGARLTEWAGKEGDPTSPETLKGILDKLATETGLEGHFEPPAPEPETPRESSLETMLRARSETIGFGLRAVNQPAQPIVEIAQPAPRPAPPTTAEQVQGFVANRQSWGGQGLGPA